MTGFQVEGKIIVKNRFQFPMNSALQEFLLPSR
jgi:hypothetical protein